MSDMMEFAVTTLPSSINLSAKQIRTWKIGRPYTPADWVLIDDHPYSCIVGHEADLNKRPGTGADTATYWTKALLPNTRYYVGEGTSGVREFVTNSATPPVARGVDSRLEHIRIDCGDETTALTAAANKKTIRAPFAMVVTEVRTSLVAAQASGTVVTVDIHKNGTTILSTKMTVDNTEKSSVTAATPAVISVTSIADDDILSIDVDAVDGSTAAAGLKVTLIGYRVG